MRLLVTCEHGGNRIPAAYRAHFAGCEAALRSHRGYDPGALRLARDLSVAFAAPLVASTVSRLLVELNRSPHHPGLWSEVTRRLPRAERTRIAARHYEPYRAAVERHVAEGIAAGQRVLHLSCHTFTPVLDDRPRTTDIGLLYDPRRRFERELCAGWTRTLALRIAPLRVRRNNPYRGYDDGLTTLLRRRFAEDAYLGVEIEVNQAHVLARGRRWQSLRGAIVRSVADLPGMAAPSRSLPPAAAHGHASAGPG